MKAGPPGLVSNSRTNFGGLGFEEAVREHIPGMSSVENARETRKTLSFD